MAIKPVRKGLLVGAGLLAMCLVLSPWPSRRAQGYPPIIYPPQTITQTTTVPVMEYVLDPPAPSYTPAVSWEQAVAIAQTQEDTTNAESIQPVLALFTNPSHVPVTDETVEDPAVTGPPIIVQVPAWLVTIDGVCIPDMAPSQPVSLCATTVATVVINADTGAVTQEYSYE
jgi:hypothetical protein